MEGLGHLILPEVQLNGKQINDLGTPLTATPGGGGAVAGFRYPRRQLIGFARAAAIAPSATATVTITPIPSALTMVDANGVEQVMAGTFNVTCGGEPDGAVAGTIVVTGPPQEIFRIPAP